MIVTIVYMVMIYSAGMPILYPLAALTFFLTYWLDKYLLLRFYRKPPVFDSYLTLKMIGMFKGAFVCHVIVSFFMFTNINIFSSYEKCYARTTVHALMGHFWWKRRNLACSHLEFLTIGVLTILGLWFIYACISCCTGCCRKKHDKGMQTHDFFSHCSYETLKDELHSTENECAKCQQMLDNWDKPSHQSHIATKKEMEDYIDTQLKPKR